LDQDFSDGFERFSAHGVLVDENEEHGAVPLAGSGSRAETPPSGVAEPSDVDELGVLITSVVDTCRA
jgi:hypothetical protein